MPEYELKLWDINSFDIKSVSFVKEAVQVKKWAFAADYIRMYALYTEGGIYLDADVYIRKSLNDFLSYDFFASLEYHSSIIEKEKTLSLINADGSSIYPDRIKPGIGLQAAVLGGIKGHKFAKLCMDFYHDKKFIKSDNQYFMTPIAPDIYAMQAEKMGFKYIDHRQDLEDNMLILPSEYFAGNINYATKKSYAIHCNAGSWRQKPSLMKKTYNKLRANNFLRLLLGKSIKHHLD